MGCNMFKFHCFFIADSYALLILAVRLYNKLSLSISLLPCQSECVNRQLFTIWSLCNFQLSGLISPKRVANMSSFFAEIKKRLTRGRFKQCRHRMCVHTYIIEGVRRLTVIFMFHMPRTNYVGIIIVIAVI